MKTIQILKRVRLAGTIALFCPAIGLGLFTGCTIVSTEERHPSEAGGHRREVGQYYFLPKGLVDIKGVNTGSAFTITIARRIVPDGRQRFFLRQHHSVMHDDDTTLTVSDEGLLTVVNTSSDDKTGDIIDKIADTVINVATISANAGGAALQLSPDGSKVQEVPQFKPFECSFDPLIPAQVAKTRSKMWECGFALDCTRATPRCTAAERIEPNESTANGGVFHRPPLIVNLQVNNRDGWPAIVRQKDALKIPDPDRIAVFDLRRRFLVKNTEALTFTKGELTGIVHKKPSEALALASIPASITQKAATAIPAIIKVQTDRANAKLDAESARLKAEKAVLDDRLALIQSRKALIGAEPAPASAALGADLRSPAPMSKTEQQTLARAALKEAQNRLKRAENEADTLKKKEDSAPPPPSPLNQTPH